MFFKSVKKVFQLVKRKCVERYLELSGKISSNLKILASVSDANIPIQPEGNTNKLQEFDKVFIQIYNDRLKLIAGDFWLSKPTGYFMNYRKRAQGLSVNYTWNKHKDKVWTTQLSGALSKGKFNRQIIQGIEANQGPYRLVGAENEPFISVQQTPVQHRRDDRSSGKQFI